MENKRLAHWPFQLAAALILLALVILTQASPLKTVDGAGFLYVLAFFLWPVLAISFALIVVGVNRLTEKDVSDEKKFIAFGIVTLGILGAAFVLLPVCMNILDAIKSMVRTI
jgi:uncharacterized membrane protein YhaH (DUF805 family)